MFSRSKTKSESARSSLAVLPVAAPGVAKADPRAIKSGKAIAAAQKPSVISEGLVMRGDVDSNGILHIEGGVVGNVKVDSANVGVGGFIEGHLTCSSLTIKGRFDGVLICDELVIASSAQIKGHVSYHFITISSGAQVEAEIEWRGAADA